jgi:hypothetical protein
MNYSDYIKSVEWVRLRCRVLDRADYCCEFCGLGVEADEQMRTPTFQVHHLSYERLGHELPHDLILLCLSCHEDVHTFPKIKEDIANFAARRTLEAW